MITKINTFKESLDKPGHEDIDMNNDGTVDNADFYLLNRRRKAKKAIDKKNENIETSVYSKVMSIYQDFNILSTLMDEGILNSDGRTLSNGLTFNDVNDNLISELGYSEPYFISENQLVTFIDRCHKVLNSY